MVSTVASTVDTEIVDAETVDTEIVETKIVDTEFVMYRPQLILKVWRLD